MTKIKRLSFVFGGLLIISLALSWIGGKEKIVSIDKSLFLVSDTTQIKSLTIESNDEVISINREDDNWTLNNQYVVDPQLIYLSQRILGAVQTQRQVSPSNFEIIKDDLNESGKKVTIELIDGEQITFYAGGNAAKTTAYFGFEDLSEIYLVAIPGYKSYLSGIFELTLDQWRDRTLFASSWRTIQRLSIDYMNADRNDLTIAFKESFLSVNGINPLDTVVLINYLKPLENFQVNDYLKKGSFPRYDSLLTVAPLASLSLEDIDVAKNILLKVYPKIDGERFYLLSNQKDEMIVVDAQRMELLLASPQKFQAK